MRSLIFGKDDKCNFFDTDLLYPHYGVFISSITSEDLEGIFARLVGVGPTWPGCLAVRSNWERKGHYYCSLCKEKFPFKSRSEDKTAKRAVKDHIVNEHPESAEKRWMKNSKFRTRPKQDLNKVH